MKESNGVLMPDGSIRKHSVFQSYKVSDTEIVLNGMNYEKVISDSPIKYCCIGCAFDYASDADYGDGSPECLQSGRLVDCADLAHKYYQPLDYIWKLKSDQ